MHNNLHWRGRVLGLLEDDLNLPGEHCGRVVFGRFRPRQFEGVGCLCTVGRIIVHLGSRGDLKVSLADFHLGAEGKM